MIGTSHHVVQAIKTRLVAHVERTAKIRNAYSILTGKTAVKRPLGRPTYRWVDNNKTCVKETGRERRSIMLGCGNVARYCECGNEPACSMKCEKSLN
jgi:hypothetical protein